MRIRTFSDPVLRRKASPIKRVNAAIRRLARSMVETMRECRGVGLAAPQVGELSRLVVVDVGEGLHVLVNPRVTRASGETVEWEGCLSFPGLLAQVKRAEKVSVEALDLEGRPAWVEAEGFFARALQHEIDHLDGVVILDRALAVEAIPPEGTAQVEPVRTTPRPGAVARGGAGPESAPEPGPEPGGAEAAPAPGRAAVRPLKVAFLGTPDFAVPALEAILTAGHSVVGVVTQPDRPAGRGAKRPRPSAVKECALSHGLPVWQGTAGEARSSLATVLAGWGAEAAVVVAYGIILPPDALRAPRLGCYNLHASLLPAYRGAAPIQRAMMDGRRVTGVTVIRMDEGVDTGDIIAQREVPVGEEDTFGTLHDRLARVGAALVVHSLELLASGRAVPRPQPAAGASAAPRLGPADEVIDWNRRAEELSWQVRALNPVPGAHTLFRDRRIKVWRAEAEGAVLPTDAPPGARPGVVVSLRDGFPVVAAGHGALTLRLLQPAGGSRMTGPEFVNGYHIEVGDRFGA